MSKILILGGSGFLGQHLVNSMQDKYDFSFTSHESKESSHDIDILQPNSYEHLLENTDTVINLIGQIDPNVQRFVQTNIVGSTNLLKSCKKNNVKKIILISSINVYGNNNNSPSKETDELKPQSNYGMVKMLNEKLYENFSMLHGIDVIILRLAGVFGPGKVKGFFPQMINAVHDNNVILKPYNDGKHQRDLIYIDDAVNGIIQSIDYNSSGVTTFNISTGTRFSVNQLISITEKISDSKINVEYIHDKFDEQCIWADNSKAEDILDFTPKTSLEDGIRKTLTK